MAAQLLRAKITHKFGDTVKIVRQQQNQVVHFFICLVYNNSGPVHEICT